MLLALDATFVVRGPGGERTVPASAFFRGLFQTALAPDEVLTQIRVPRTGARGWSYLKFHRRAQDWALVGVAALAPDGDGPAVALTNLADRPIRAAGVEEALRAGADPSPPSDHVASAEYRRELVKVVARRALEEALAR